MKRISILTMAALLMTALFAGNVFADAFDVTASFGVRVTEQGISEQVGEITISQKDINVDVFTAGQIITVELLGNATISRTFTASYAYDGGNYIQYSTDPAVVNAIVPGTTAAPVDAAITDDDADGTIGSGGDALVAADYRIVAIEDDDFFTIEVFNDSAVGDSIVVGHEEDALDVWNAALAAVVPPAAADGIYDATRGERAAGQYSALCFNLEGTIYNSADPAQQLVQVSYADNNSNTFSGDIYVATVKPSTVEIDTCFKEVQDLELTYAESQDLDCGHGTASVCLFEFSDPAAGALDGEYAFRVGKTTGAFEGLGITALFVQKSADAGVTWGDVDGNVGASTAVAIGTRWNSSGNEVELADFDDDDNYTAADYLYLASSQVEGTVMLTGTAADVLYRLYATVRYDTCTATEGEWLIDVVASRVPCGGSFGATDWLAANVVPEGGTPQIAVFPYAAGLGAGWYNGLSIWNPNAGDLEVTFAITEADGDAYEATITVPAGEMSVGLAETLLAPTTTGSDSAFGDENYNITAEANGLFYGFLFITNGTVAQGYLPIMNPTLEER